MSALNNHQVVENIEDTIVIDRTIPRPKRFYDEKTIKNSDRKKRKYKDFKTQTFDTETWGLNPENLALSVFFDGVNYHVQYDKESVLEHIQNIKEDTLIYAHNGMNFDFILFFEYVLSRLVKYKKYGDISSMEMINRQGAKIVFKDSVYIFASKLSDLGKSFGSGEYKGTTPQKFINPSSFGFDYNAYNDDVSSYNQMHLETIDIDYCKQDCLVLWEVIHHEEVEKLDIKNYNTIAKIANEKMFDTIPNGIDVEAYYDRPFKNLYAGGLTDVLKHQVEGKIVCYDFNSMYPYAMVQEFSNPTSLDDYFYGNKSQEYIDDVFFDMLENYPNGLSIVNFSISKDTPKDILRVLKRIPLIPKYKTSYSDLFDGRTYKIEIMNPELANMLNPLLKEYVTIEPLSSIHCERKDLITPFKAFIEHLYSERLKNKISKPAYAQALKILMNSSYGYLAMQTKESDYVFGDENLIGHIIRELIEEKLYDVNMQEVKTFKEFVNEFTSYDEVMGEPIIPSLYDYIDYLKNYVVGDNDEFQIKTLESVFLDGVNSDYYILYWEGAKTSSQKTCFSLASEITSKSRALLTKCALEIEYSGNNVCYMDTDSFHIEVLNQDTLDEVLKDYLDDNELGKLKDEGTYELAYWFAKKHYYLFSKTSQGYVLEKEALKGFAKEKPIDAIIYERNIVNVSKIATRIKRVSLDTNAFSKDKNFLNFTVSRDTLGNFFPHQSRFDIGNSSREITKHKKQLKDLYFSMLNRGDIYIPNKYREDKSEVIPAQKLTLDFVKERIEEINTRLANNLVLGVYKGHNMASLLPLVKEKELARDILGIEEAQYRITKFKDRREESQEAKRARATKKKQEYRVKLKEEKEAKRLDILEHLNMKGFLK